jgi:hypothetical protein
VSVGFGLYDRKLSPATATEVVANALRRSDLFVWFYTEGVTFLKPPDAGGAGLPWVEAIRKGRAEVHAALR